MRPYVFIWSEQGVAGVSHASICHTASEMRPHVFIWHVQGSAGVSHASICHTASEVRLYVIIWSEQGLADPALKLCKVTPDSFIDPLIVLTDSTTHHR